MSGRSSRILLFVAYGLIAGAVGFAVNWGWVAAGWSTAPGRCIALAIGLFAIWPLVARVRNERGERLIPLGRWGAAVATLIVVSALLSL